MELQHTFTVPVGIDRAWEVLLDVETIAPCMPGAALDTVDGDAFTGTVKVKLGPIGLTYKGKASFVEKDVAAHKAVIDAQGRDARGNGTANATVTATLQSKGDAETEVVVNTDLAITGKPAQFGRGVMVDVGNKLIGQFADCLAGKLSAPDAEATSEPTAAAPVPTATSEPSAAEAPKVGLHAAAEPASAATTTVTEPVPAPVETAATTPAPAPAPRKIAPPAHEVEPIDLMASAGPALAKRLVPVGVAVLVAALVAVLWRRRG